MQVVLLTALGVGGATIIGAVIGFIFKKISHRFSDIVLSFAAGVMLAAAVIGLILPSLEYGGRFSLVITVCGIFVGAFCLNLIDTAGIHETDDKVEKIGVNRAKDFAKDADLIVYVVDSSVALDESDMEIMNLIQDKKTIILLNKSININKLYKF